MEDRIDLIKTVIRDYFDRARHGLFFSQNVVDADYMKNVYRDNGVIVDVCYQHGYFEVFGLSADEQDELYAYYKSLKKGEQQA